MKGSSASMQARKHNLEAQRLERVASYEILDTPAEREFDDITRLVAHICKTPIALISLVDAGRQWFKSEIGLGVTQTPLDCSICAHAILEPGVFQVTDALADPRFANNPLVAGKPNVRFYAGAPLESQDGLPLGTLCVLDYQPRELSEEQKHALRILARQVMVQLELRRSVLAQSKVIEEQEAIRAALSKANRTKDQFLAALSHELRTPLAPVLMMTQALEADESLPHAAREDLALIRRNVELEARLIDDLLDVTRVAHGKLTVNPRPVDAHEAIRQAYNTCRAGERHRRLDALTLELGAARPWVHADPARLQQVVWNLLKNAIKFTPEGRPIVLRTRNVNGADGDDELVIEVVDAGRGIDPDLLPRIFNAFEQGEGAVTRQFGGLGLGLAICKAVVDLHGGRIEALSEGPDRGATFRVHLKTIAHRPPIKMRESCGAATEPPATTTAARRPLRILLVEDDAGTATIMARLLGRYQHSVKTATTVRSAMETADECAGQFDLLISDLGLPDGSGHVLMEEIRRRYAIPGIALSGYAMEEDLRLSSEAGFSAHLVKPVDLGELTATIDRLAGGK